MQLSTTLKMNVWVASCEDTYLKFLPSTRTILSPIFCDNQWSWAWDLFGLAVFLMAKISHVGITGHWTLDIISTTEWRLLSSLSQYRKHYPQYNMKPKHTEKQHSSSGLWRHRVFMTFGVDCQLFILLWWVSRLRTLNQHSIHSTTGLDKSHHKQSDGQLTDFLFAIKALLCRCWPNYNQQFTGHSWSLLHRIWHYLLYFNVYCAPQSSQFGCKINKHVCMYV